MEDFKNPSIVAELKAAAEDALTRGFAILTCKPHEKDPWPKYSEHAVNSATTVPDIALRPWNDGYEANYGVSGGKSNLAIIDVDSGINDETELYAWMAKVGLPETFVVQSGRTSSFGAHLYYSGKVPTTQYNLENVVGEVRSNGAYVVGPGSVHPSGEKYSIVKDSPIANLPDPWRAMCDTKDKSKADFKTNTGDLIPEGHRWAHLQSKAGQFKNLGFSEETIFLGLKDFASTHCENGENYPEEKLKQLAEWAASNDCDVLAPEKLVTIGTPDPENDTCLPELPIDCITGDYLGDLALGLTKGTFIPPSFARATLKTIAGSILDGRIAFPGEETLHMRHWNALVSSRPEMGKSTIWKRCMLFMGKLIQTNKSDPNSTSKPFTVIFPPAGFFSSGEHAIRTLAENDGEKHLAYFDEMAGLFTKASNSGSTLFSKLLELYEQTSGSVGSITHTAAKFDNVSLSMTGGFTRSGFDRAVSGKNAGGDGFLSRMVLDYSSGISHSGDWEPLDPELINPAMAGIEESLKSIYAKSLGEELKGMPFIPIETPEAKELRKQFQVWLRSEKERIQMDNPDSSYASRLEAHFKRDLLIRVAFSKDKTITKEMVRKSMLWAAHQLRLREELWPVDNGGAIEKCEKRILSAITRQGPLTKIGIQKWSNSDHGEGGYEAWNRAWTNLLKADKIINTNLKWRGSEKFGLKAAVWNKEKKKWLFET